MSNITSDALIQISKQISRAMVNDLRLAQPAQYVWTKYNGRVWMLAALPRDGLGRQTESYFDPKTLRHLSDVVGKPVTANRAAMVYLVLLSEKPKLPTRIEFPHELPGKDIFAWGMSLRGPVHTSAASMGNVMIGATQDAGKSNLLKVLTYQARFQDWMIYLCDPQGHTYPPETWDTLAAAPVAKSGAELSALISQVDGELKIREGLFRKASQSRSGVVPADLEAYNAQTEITLPRFALFVDEANDFLEHKSIESEMTRLARAGRKFGFHLFVAAHNWRDSRGRGVSREFSGRMTTRISLKVSDDTSGDVVLENLRWGKWVTRRLPKGRGCIRLNGNYLPVQIYYIPENLEASWLSNTRVQVASILSDTERAMVSFAVEKMDGAFKLREISEAFGLTLWKVRQLGSSWEQYGWLSTPVDAISPRMVTDKLLDLAGISRTGAQAAQVSTGPTQAAQAVAQAAQAEAGDAQ
jgi:hypothetical protein